MKSCYLGVCRGDKEKIKRRLVAIPGVYRITDHGSHVKVNTTKPLPAVRGFRAIRTRDRSTHWDVKYWDFCMDAFRYATKKRHDRKALDVLLHYLVNLFGEGDREEEFYAMLAANRRWINRAWTDERAHGWEITALRKATLLP